MLIELDESIAEAPQTDASLEALEALGRCDAHGYHLVATLPGVARRIGRQFELSGLAARAFRRIAGDETGWAVTRDRLYASLRVEAGLDSPTWIGTPGSGILRYPLSWCGRPGFERPSVLIGEHYHDTRLFTTMARAFVVSERLGSLRVCVEQVLGGGSTTPEVYADRQRSLPPCLAIVDGDRTYPGGPEGDVARAMRGANDNTRQLAAWLPLPVRAAENALPHPLLREVIEHAPDEAAALAQHEELQTRGLGEVLEVTNLRSGTHFFEALAHHTDEQRRAFWAGVRAGLEACPSVPQRPTRCTAGCPADRHAECTCPMVLGLGQVLPRVVREAGQRSPHNVLRLVDDRTRETWTNVGSRVAAWGAARTPLQS